jgi:GLPGLI family protein
MMFIIQKFIYETLFLFFLLLGVKANTQTSVSKNQDFQCTYTTVFNKSFDNGQNFLSFESALLISGSKSVFFSLPTKDSDKDANENNNFIDLKKDTLFKVIKIDDQNILLFKDDVFSKKGMNYSDSLYPMKWELIDEKKMLDSLFCYKAITFFKGRNYIAWYCPQISLINGPWKLGGLPGLIVEAYDENKQLHFLLKDLKTIKDSKSKIQYLESLDINAIPTYAEYIKSGKAFIRKFLEQLDANSSDKCLTCQTTSKIKFNNWENVFN